MVREQADAQPVGAVDLVAGLDVGSEMLYWLALDGCRAQLKRSCLGAGSTGAGSMRGLAAQRRERRRARSMAVAGSLCASCMLVRSEQRKHRDDALIH